jgi:TRAP transporter TAXI family solute receptor
MRILSKIIILSAFCGVLANTVAAQETTFFRIGTGPTADTLYSVGTAIAAGISNPLGSRPCDKGGSCGVAGLIATAQSTGGAFENVELIRRGELDSALVQADVAHWSHYGTGPYITKAPISELRVVANIFRVAVHVVVRADSQIRTIYQLEGKRVSLGPAGSGARENSRDILGVYGISVGDIKVRQLKPGPAADALMAGEIDAYFEVGAEPIAAIADLAKQLPLRLLAVAGPPGKILRETRPFFAKAKITDGTYENVLGVPSVSLAEQWIISANTPIERVKDLTRALWHENTRRMLAEAHPNGKFDALEYAARNITVPLHLGAKAYYDELKAEE